MARRSVESRLSSLISTPYEQKSSLETMAEMLTTALEKHEMRKEARNNDYRSIMSQFSKGTSMIFNDEDLKARKNRLQNYYNKHMDGMDETTLELGQFMLEDFDTQAKKNKDFNFLVNDGEQLRKDMMYDMENIGVDEEGNRRILDENDYEIISGMQKKWIDHTKKMRVDFADRLSLKPFEHINAELANAKNINDFLLLEAREDDLIDDKEMQAYKDAWTNLNYSPVQKYLTDQQTGKTASVTFNTNELLSKAKRYSELNNLFKNKGYVKFNDPQTGQMINITAEQLKRKTIDAEGKVLRGSVEAQFLNSLITEYDALPQQLRNLNATNMKISNTDFLRTTDLSLHEIPPNVQEQILAGEKTMLDVPEVKETVGAPIGRAEKVKEAVGISDNDMSSLGKLGVGIGVAGAASQAENIAKGVSKVADVTVKSAKYIEELTHLSPSKITEFLSSKDVGANLGKIETLETDITEFKSKIKSLEAEKGFDKLNVKERIIHKRSLSQNKKDLTKATDEIKDIKTKMSKRWANKFKTKPRIISSLFKKGTTDKWNLWKAKAGLPKAMTRYAIGSTITDALGAEFEGVARVGVDITTGYATEKLVTKKFFPQLKRIIQSPKSKKYLLKYLSKTAVQKIGTAAVLGGGWLSLATSLVGAGLVAGDIYNIVKNWNPEEEE
ncbi:hypothetical protein CMI37_27440 [Candidatus Pacearchaeota archaeon]|nr:hypothetical protein [Candidatus Pacearchaeota archaeon]